MPLMMDMEEEEDDSVHNKSRGLEAGLENDFAYNNNVAGASKHVRLGEVVDHDHDDNDVVIDRIHEEGVWIVGSSTVHHNLDWGSLPLYSWCQGICPGN